MAVGVNTLVVQPHPFDDRGTIRTVEQFQPDETLGHFVRRTGIEIPKCDFELQCNGIVVPIDQWQALRPKPGDLVNIYAKAHGGDSGKILGSVAMIALTLVAPGIGNLAMANGIMLGGMSAGSAAILGSFVTMGVMVAGSLLISALFPPPKPTDLGTGSKYESSPTYSLSGGRNQARPWQPMTLIFGRHKVVPDAGAQPYVVNSGDDQYLNQIFHFGLQAGGVTLTDFRIGQTPIENFQGVTLQQSDTTGALSLFAGNVNTLQGFTLASGVVNQRTTVDKTTYINIDLAATLFGVDDQGNMQTQTVQITVQYAPAGSGAWVNAASYAVDSYATNYWSLQVTDTAENNLGQTYLTQRQVQFGSVNYGDHTEGEQVLWKPGHWEGFAGDGQWWVSDVYAKWHWVVHPYAQGRPWQGVAPDPFLGTVASPGIQMSGAKQDATKASIGWSVTAGKYDIRIWKVTADLSDSRTHNDVAVQQILCYQQDTSDYSGQLRVALQIKASDQLNGAVDELSAIATAWAAVWDGTQFVWAQTRNPAWWFLWFARGKVSGNRVYGGGFPDSQIDIEGIKAWAVFCDSKGLTFDYVLDQAKSCDDVLSMIARAGRASRTWQTGRLGVVWDDPNRLVSAMFGPFNIKAGTFKIDYINGDTPDEIIANFADAANGWQMGEVRVVVPGATTTINPMQLDLEGVTSAAIAGKEANLLAAAQVWHRRQVSWETDAEGWMAHRGNVVQISHDLTVWGYSGRVLERNGNTLTLQTKLPIGTGTLMLRDPDGNMKTVAVTGGTDTDQITLPDMAGFALPGDPGYEDVPAVDWAWFFDPAATPGRRFRITSVSPGDDSSVKFTAVDDAPEYYASEDNPYAYTPPRDGQLLAGQIISFAVHEGWYNSLTGEAPITVAWVLSTRKTVTLTVSVNGTQRYAGDVEGTSIDLSGTRRGDVITASLQMRPAVGPVITANTTYTVLGLAQIPTPVTLLTFALDGPRVALKWSRSSAPDVTGYELRSDDSGWGDANALFRGDALSASIPAPAVGVATAWYVRPYTAAGLYSTTSATATLTLNAVPQVTGVAFNFFDTSETSATVTLTWAPAHPQLGLRGYRIEYPGVSVTADTNSVTLPANWIDNRLFSITTIDAAGNESAPAQISITKLRPNPASGLRANVIDNNVMLYWTLPEPTTLPISHVHIKQGPDWDGAAEIGTKKGSFDVLTETTPGQKTYWIRVVDTDGWESDPVAYAAVVDQPPDFKLNADQFSHFTGTLQNAVVEGGRVLARDVDVTATERDTFVGDRISTQPGDVWHVHGTVNNVGSAYTAAVGVFFMDAAGGALTWLAAATLPAGQSAELDGFVTAPAGAAQAQLWLQMDMPAGTSGQQAVWTGVYGTDRRNARLVMPVNTDETWADHFGTRSWPTIQAQVDAGYPIYTQPTVAFSQYQEVFDFAQVFASSRVDVILDSLTVAGTPTTMVEMEISLDGVTYEPKQQAAQIFGTNFRFVRVTIKVLQDADDHGVFILRTLECRLSTKLRNDAGTVNCNAADPDGTLANFNTEFVDVQSVTATAMGTEPRATAAAYKDSILDGTYSITDGVVSASILNHEQIVGQAVRMAYANGPVETVIITSVPDANHFTAASARPNKSGNVRAYSQGARYYLFDQSGVRQSGKVSWAVKGN